MRDKGVQVGDTVTIFQQNNGTNECQYSISVSRKVFNVLATLPVRASLLLPDMSSSVHIARVVFYFSFAKYIVMVVLILKELKKTKKYILF